MMTEFLKLEEDEGVFTTILPPFDDQLWPEIISSQSFIWVQNPPIEFSVQLEPLVSKALFNDRDLDLRCSINRIELDLSLPACDFLRFTRSVFARGLDFIQSQKHQPAGFHLESISRSRWPTVMAQNQIDFVFHRPMSGEPSLVISPTRDILSEMIDRFSDQNNVNDQKIS